MEKDFQREEKEIRQVQPMPVDAQVDLGAATGMGCTEIEKGRGNIFYGTFNDAGQASLNNALKLQRGHARSPLSRATLWDPVQLNCICWAKNAHA